MTVVEGLVRHSNAHAELRGARCRSCGQHSFPPRNVCGSCGSREHDEAWLSGRGTVHACTEVSLPPAGFDQPYIFGTVDLVEGPRTVGILREQPRELAVVQAVPGHVRDRADGFVFTVVD